MSEFICNYEVDDGYVEKSISQSFSIEYWQLEDDMDESDLSDLFDECMKRDFEELISPYEKNKEDFIKWAKKQIEEMKSEEVE